MISPKMEEELNKQVQAEIYSAYLYLSMSSYCSSKNLDGFAHWLFIQSEEEMVHAMKIYNYINEQGGVVKLLPIQQPPVEFKSVKDVAEQQYAHEQKVTALINKLVNLANDEKDYATNIFLQWFITEQIEEEKSASDIINKLEIAGEKGQALYMLDKEMGARQFHPPAEPIGV